MSMFGAHDARLGRLRRDVAACLPAIRDAVDLAASEMRTDEDERVVIAAQGALAKLETLAGRSRAAKR